MKNGDPLLVLISHNKETIIVSNIDDAGEHIILLRLAGFSDNELDNFYRIVLNSDGADWTFVCPNNYKGIENKQYRIKQFYNDGFNIIPDAIKVLGYNAELSIPKRYKRHFDML